MLKASKLKFESFKVETLYVSKSNLSKCQLGNAGFDMGKLKQKGIYNAYVVCNVCRSMPVFGPMSCRSYKMHSMCHLLEAWGCEDSRWRRPNLDPGCQLEPCTKPKWKQPGLMGPQGTFDRGFPMDLPEASFLPVRPSKQKLDVLIEKGLFSLRKKRISY